MADGHAPLPTVGSASGHNLTGTCPGVPTLRTGMVDAVGRWVVLIDHEQQARKDAVWFFDAEAEKPLPTGRHPTRRRTGESRGLDEVAVGGVCVAIMLVFIGAPVVGLVVGGATALGWLLWRPLPHLSTTTTACALLLRGDVRGVSDAGGGSANTPGPRRLHPRRQPTKALPKRRPGGVPRFWTGPREGGER
jgi:hypothetical protein